MTTQTILVDEIEDHRGLPITNFAVQSVAALPATTYPRVVYLTTVDGPNPADHYYEYIVGTGWEQVGAAGSGSVDDTAYDATTWNGDTTHAPSKNAVRDKMELMAPLASPALSGNPTVPTQSAGDNSTKAASTAYADGSSATAAAAVVSDTAYNAGTWDGVTGVAPSKNAIRDKIELLAPLASPTFTGTPVAPTAAASTNTTQIATTAMVQAAIAAYVTASDIAHYKGVIDASANPNYPSAEAGEFYRISVAGKIGGASGVNVEVGDVVMAIADNAGGNQATVGTSWMILQTNIDGAVVGPASSTGGNLPTFSGTSGKIIQDSGTALSAVALLASPTFTGTPAAPTAAATTNTTQIATTAMVQSAISGKSYAADIGDGTTEDIVVTHNLGSTDVIVEIRDAAGAKLVRRIPWAPTSTNAVTVYCPTGLPLASAECRIVVRVP